MVYAIAYAHINHREAAEEVAQETFLRAYLSLESLKQTDHFAGWVARITRNVAETWRVRGQTRSRIAQMVPLDETHHEVAETRQLSAREQLSSKRETEALNKALAKLPGDTRELVLLHFLEGMTKTQIARKFGVYPSTISRNIDKALQLLRQEIGSAPAAASAIASSPAARRGTLVLIAGAAAMSQSAKAAVCAAAAAELNAVVAATSSAIAQSTTSSLEKLGELAPGGKTMFAFKALAVASLAGTIVLATINRVNQPELREEPPLIAQGASTPAPTARAERSSIAAALSENLSANMDAATSHPCEILGIREAEDCKITCKAEVRIGNDSWSSGGRLVGYGWGDAAGDSAEFDTSLEKPVFDLKLGLRYAYHDAPYVRDYPNRPVPHRLDLFINGQGPIRVEVPDTEGWNHMKIATVYLPPLPQGNHSFRLVASAAESCVNLDAFVFFRGDVDPITGGPLRPTRLAGSEPVKFVICANPDTSLPDVPDKILATYQQLREMMVSDYGKGPDGPIFVHFAGPKYWDQRVPAMKNRFGIYLAATGKPLNRADWCWTLAEYFGDRRVPPWFRHSSARVSGLLEWLPALDASTAPAEDTEGARLLARAKAFLDDPTTVAEQVETVHGAIRVRYGTDVFRKFWSFVAQTPQLTDNNAVWDKGTLMSLMSQAAAADVTPLYRRWRGFAAEGPVDPLVLTDAQTRL